MPDADILVNPEPSPVNEPVNEPVTPDVTFTEPDIVWLPMNVFEPVVANELVLGVFPVGPTAPCGPTVATVTTLVTGWVTCVVFGCSLFTTVII